MKPESQQVAIIGMAGLFPEAGDLGAYWSNILEAVDCLKDVPDTHWSPEDYYDPDPRAVDKTYARRGGFIPKTAFDPLEFGLPPNILELTDVSQLLALVVAKKALADSGYGDHNPVAATTGVVFGASALNLGSALSARLQYPIWDQVLQQAGVEPERRRLAVEAIKAAYVPWQEDSFPGFLSNVVAGRVANRLNLGGINCTLDAACASSLASVQMAVDELLLGRTDLMLAGGVDLNNSISAFVSFSKTPAFTAKAFMRPFDADSDGMLIGEGVGALVLKRLDDARRDGDRVYAVVRGIGSSSDGRYRSIYAPSRDGQVLALERAYRDAGVSPLTIGLVEAHGTGTKAGDPAEVSALTAVFGDAGARVGSIALGSVKSQIGHTKVAAGVAGIIKAALALHEKVLPPTIHIAKPNPLFQLELSPFYLNTLARPWFSSEVRRAGVSAFGFGGTNFHVVLEESDSQNAGSVRANATPFTVLIQAPTLNQLIERWMHLAVVLSTPEGADAFRDLVEAPHLPVPEAHPRVGFLASDRQQAKDRIEQVLDRLLTQPEVDQFSTAEGVHYRRTGLAATGSVVALFPGQGSQYLEMGRTATMSFSPIRVALEGMDQTQRSRGLTPVTEVLFPPPSMEQDQRLRETDHAQGAIGALSLGLFQVLENCGFRPDFVAGHSLGEITALRAAGVLTDAEFFQVLSIRGQAMKAASAARSGAMVAVTGDLSNLAKLMDQCPGVWLANRNSPTQVVLAGDPQALETLPSEATTLGLAVIPLAVSGAFHTPWVEPAQAPLDEALREMKLKAPRVPVYSNETGKPYPRSAPAIQARLVGQMVKTVDFVSMIETMYQDGGRIFVEVGPSNVLTRLVGSILSQRPHLALSVNASKTKDSDWLLRDAHVQLLVAGLTLKSLDSKHRPPTGWVKPNPGTIQLSGAPYVSEATRKGFESALSILNTHSISLPSQTQKQEVLMKPTPDSTQPPQATQGSNDQLFQLLQQQFALIEGFQNNVARFQQQLGAQPAAPRASVPLPSMPAIAGFSPRQPEPLRQPEPPRPPEAPRKPQAPRPVEAAAPASLAPSLPQDGGSAEILLSVISETTGYPLEALDLSMDLDSDLGIDSIKRVQILAALEGRSAGPMTNLNFESFAKLRTLGQIADYLDSAKKKP